MRLSFSEDNSAVNWQITGYKITRGLCDLQSTRQIDRQNCKEGRGLTKSPELFQS